MLKNLFHIRIVWPQNVWPLKSDTVTVKLLTEIKLPYVNDANPDVAYPYHPGRVLNLERMANPFGQVDPWMVVTTSGITGASERWWRELVETGKAEIVLE